MNCIKRRERFLENQLISSFASIQGQDTQHTTEQWSGFTLVWPLQGTARLWFIVKFFGTFFQGYQITMSYTADGRYKMEFSNATMPSSTFRFLEFDTRYTFQVRTRFSKDNSLGPPVHVIKTTDAFTAPVGRVTAKVAGYSSVFLSWSAPGTIRPKALKVKMYLILSIFFLFLFWQGVL